ncbi:alpha/beta fold hydrolase [Nocardiopsis baichengensis]|uniref:alpha/beta fold hydrolase n=1 Tax=Nocardiopsis baichengensis TaxID=280240 RepID=UPI000347580D|nr:alpha/beta hydrolase [Nocardiopsis baichengensis]
MNDDTSGGTAPSAPLATTVAGQGPALLLAHGATGNTADNFGPIMGALTARRTVIAPDYPGSGSTPPDPRPLDLDDLADRLVAAADRAGARTFPVLAFSMGTQVAIRAAARHPERVEALVLSAGLAFAEGENRRTFEAWRAEIAAAGPPFDPPGALDHVDLLLSNDVRGDLASIDVPVLVIKTLKDELVLPGNSDELAAGIRGARTAELSTGHLIWEEDAEGWERLVTGFLDGL